MAERIPWTTTAWSLSLLYSTLPAPTETRINVEHPWLSLLVAARQAEREQCYVFHYITIIISIRIS